MQFIKLDTCLGITATDSKFMHLLMLNEQYNLLLAHLSNVTNQMQLIDVCFKQAMSLFYVVVSEDGVGSFLFMSDLFKLLLHGSDLVVLNVLS